MGATTTKVPGIGMKMLGEVIPGIGSYNTHQYGYTTNQSSMSDAINAMMSMFGMPGVNGTTNGMQSGTGKTQSQILGFNTANYR